MAEQELSVEVLAEEYELLKRQYEEMEAAYQLQLKQKSENPLLRQAKRDLQETREACVAMSNQRDALLDRILELERAARLHKDAAITTRRGTARESRLRARLLPSLNESLKSDLDPHASSRHVGPDAVQSRNNQRATQQQAAIVASATVPTHHDQTGVLKPEPDRSIVKLPKRARTSKAGGATGQGRSAASSSSNMHVFAVESAAYPTLTMEGDVLTATAPNGESHHPPSGPKGVEGQQ